MVKKHIILACLMFTLGNCVSLHLKSTERYRIEDSDTLKEVLSLKAAFEKDTLDVNDTTILSLYLTNQSDSVLYISHPFRVWISHNILVNFVGFYSPEHLGFDIVNDAITPTNNHSDDPKEEEFDADLNAFYLMCEHENLAKTKPLFAIGCIVALGSLIFMDNSLQGGNMHPDPNYRIIKIFDMFSYLDEQALRHSYNFVTMLFKMWAWYYNKEEIMPKADECKDLKDYYEKMNMAFDAYKK